MNMYRITENVPWIVEAPSAEEALSLARHKR